MKSDDPESSELEQELQRLEADDRDIEKLQGLGTAEVGLCGIENETRELDDPVARRLDVIGSSFGPTATGRARGAGQILALRNMTASRR